MRKVTTNELGELLYRLKRNEQIDRSFTETCAAKNIYRAELIRMIARTKTHPDAVRFRMRDAKKLQREIEARLNKLVDSAELSG